MLGDEQNINSLKKNSKKKNRVLLVDDDPDTTRISKTALERNGFEVQAFENPISALDNFKPGSYDLLLIDIKMRDGWFRTL